MRERPGKLPQGQKVRRLPPPPPPTRAPHSMDSQIDMAKPKRNMVGSEGSSVNQKIKRDKVHLIAAITPSISVPSIVIPPVIVVPVIIPSTPAVITVATVVTVR